MRYVTEEQEAKIQRKPLWEIYQEMKEARAKWYQKAFELFHVPFVTDIYMPPVTFMLAFCIEKARGTMAWGNWLRIPFNYHVGPNLDDDQVLLSGPIVDFGWGLLAGTTPIKPPRFKLIEEAVLEKINEMPLLPPVS